MAQPSASTQPPGPDPTGFRTSAYSLVAVDVASDDAASQGDGAGAGDNGDVQQSMHDEENIEWEMMPATTDDSDAQDLDGDLEWRGGAVDQEVGATFDPWDVNHERRSAIELWRQFGERYDGARPWHEEENLAATHDEVQSNMCATEPGTVATPEEPIPLPPVSFSPPVAHRLSTTHVPQASAVPEPANRLSVSAFVTPTASPAADSFEFESLPPPTPAADVCGPSTPVPGAWAASASMRSLSSMQQATARPQDLADLASGLGINLDGTTPPPPPARSVPFEILEDAASDSSSEDSCDAFESADEGDEGVWRSNRASRQSKALSWFQAADAFEKQHGCARGPSGWRTSVRYSTDCRRSIIGRPSPDSKRLSKMLAISAVRSPPQSAFIEPAGTSPAISEAVQAQTTSTLHDAAIEEESSDCVEPEMPFLTRSASLSSEEPETPAASEPVFELQVADEADHADSNFVAWRQSFGTVPTAPFTEREIFSVKETRSGEASAPRRPQIAANPDTAPGEAYPSASARRQSRRMSRRMSSQMPRNSAAAAENRKSVQAYRRLTAMVNATPIQLNEAPSQSSWRSSLHPRVWEQLCSQFGAKEMHRQEVIWELCATERSFVQSLCSIQRVFSLPLRTADGRWMPGVPTAAARLFDWLDDILQLHSKLSASLDRSRAAHPSPVVVQIAPSALKHVDGLVVHQPYLVRFEDVTRTIEAIIRDADATAFGRFLEKQLRIPECSSMSLSSFLLKPVQRLMKYPLFFKVRACAQRTSCATLTCLDTATAGTDA
jgi:hypothetical protein